MRRQVSVGWDNIFKNVLFSTKNQLLFFEFRLGLMKVSFARSFTLQGSGGRGRHVAERVVIIVKAVKLLLTGHGRSSTLYSQQLANY